MTECIYCNENDNLIIYEHTCGKYYIHQECLDKWFYKHGVDCIICRNNIIENDNQNIEEPVNQSIQNLEIIPSNLPEPNLEILPPNLENHQRIDITSNNLNPEYNLFRDQQNPSCCYTKCCRRFAYILAISLIICLLYLLIWGISGI